MRFDSLTDGSMIILQNTWKISVNKKRLWKSMHGSMEYKTLNIFNLFGCTPQEEVEEGRYSEGRGGEGIINLQNSIYFLKLSSFIR